MIEESINRTADSLPLPDQAITGPSSDGPSAFARALMDREEGPLAEISRSARSRNIPICLPETLALLRVLVRIRKPLRILEAGTAVGHSAAVMALAQPATGIVDTMEIDPRMAGEAEENLRRLGLDQRVRVLEGDASDIMQCLTTPYDLIFLDAAKGQYPEYLKEARRLLSPDGVLVSDNVLYKGLVALSEVPHKHRTIRNRLHEFLTGIIEDPELDTSLLDIGDGIAITVLRQDATPSERRDT